MREHRREPVAQRRGQPFESRMRLALRLALGARCDKTFLLRHGSRLQATQEMLTMKSPRIISDPEIVGGTPVFIGTRVPGRILFEHLEAGDSLEVFLEDFPSVSRELAVQVLEDAKAALVVDAHPA